MRTIKTNKAAQVHIDLKTAILLVLLSCSLPIYVHLNQDSFKISINPNQYPTTHSVYISNQAIIKPACCLTPGSVSPTSRPPSGTSSTTRSAKPWSSLPCPQDPWPPPIPRELKYSAWLKLPSLASQKLKSSNPSKPSQLLEAPSSWLTMQQRNSKTKAETGNRGQRGRGIKLVAWNKGNSFLQNKHPEIENLIAGHHPHILGLSEANLKKNVDLRLVQHDHYELHTAPTMDNPALEISRVVVYTHSSLVVKRRSDL